MSRVLKMLHVRDLDVGEAAPARKESRSETVGCVGVWRDASSILYELENAGSAVDGQVLLDKVLVIDFNPKVMAELRRRGISSVYGDIAHADTLRHAGIEGAELVLCSITDHLLRGTSNLRMLRNARASCPKAKVMLTTERIRHALELYASGGAFAQ